MGDCIFCQVVKNEVPSTIVYEDELCIAFMDIFPIRPGHTLVIPKQHAAYLHQLPQLLRTHLFNVANAILDAQRAAGITQDGANFLVNDGKAANQHVPHVHIHVLPRTKGDMVSVCWTFLTRMLNVFGREKKRIRLEAQANQISKQLKL